MASQPNGGVSFAIMAHPTRLGGVSRVLGQLGRECEIVVDQDSLGPWWCARRAWGLTPSDCSWRCLLQDDIDLAPGFADQLELLVQNPLLNQRPLALYNGLTMTPDLAWAAVVPPRDIPNAGERWIERRDGVQGPALVMAQPDIPLMLDWCARHVMDTLRSADIRPSLWLESAGRSSLCPVPSWVQHRGWEESLLGTKSGISAPRTAPSYTGAPLSGIDWTLGLEAPRQAGLVNGASLRIRTKLWRVGATETDWILSKQRGQRA